jgi:glycosyltransferase involved in cell wall biosynthesis
MPRVSVIIPVLNSAATVADAIESVFAQTFTDCEIIAVYAESADDSLAVLERYAGRITILHQRDRGPSAGRNLAVRASHGTYLGFLDADDLWAPTMLERAVAVLDANPGCAMVYTDCRLIDSTGRDLGTTLIDDVAAPTVQDMLERLWPIQTSAVVMPRWAFERAGGFPEELITFEDVFFWLRVREIGPFHYIAEPLAAWRFSLFPGALKKLSFDESVEQTLDRMMRERYGVSAARHIIGRRRAPRSILAYIGLNAMLAGDRALARRAFSHALRIDPWRVKNYLRFARTFLPTALARALSGRTYRAGREPWGRANPG